MLINDFQIEKKIIKPNKLFYKIYNDYLQDPNNNESNNYILNLVNVNNKLIIPQIITKKKYIEKNLNSNSSNNLSTYQDTFKSQLLKKNQKCNVCLDTFQDNYVITNCHHIFCFLCFNKLHKYNYKNRSKQLRHHIGNNHLGNTCKVIPITQNINCTHNEIKCPKCDNSIDYNKCYIISNNYSAEQNKLKCLLHLFKNNIIQTYLLQHIGYKTIYFLKEIDKFIQINKSSNKLYFLIFNQEWISFLTQIIPKSKLQNIKFITLDCIKNKKFINENFINKNFKIIIIELLKLNNKKKIFNFIENIKSKSTKKFQIINIVIKNTIDEKIFNNQVIIN